MWLTKGLGLFTILSVVAIVPATADTRKGPVNISQAQPTSVRQSNDSDIRPRINQRISQDINRQMGTSVMPPQRQQGREAVEDDLDILGDHDFFGPAESTQDGHAGESFPLGRRLIQNDIN